MQTIIKNRKTTWINLFSPTTEEIEGVQKKYDLHPMIAEEMKRPTLRSKVDTFGETIYLILHFPVYDAAKKTCIGREIDFVIGKNFVITAHYDMIETLDRIAGTCDIDTAARDRCLGENSGQLLFSILKPLYDYSLRELDHIHKKINKIEEKIFGGEEKEMVREISALRREILDFRRAMYPQEQILASLEKAGEHFFPKTSHPYLSYISGEYFKLWSALDNYKETIEALEETNNSLLSARTNEVMKTLTVLSFVVMPLMIITGIFGMNTVHIPIVGNTYDFWIVLGLMTVFGISMYALFKRLLHWI
jgi:magnesium transporter